MNDQLLLIRFAFAPFLNALTNDAYVVFEH